MRGSHVAWIHVDVVPLFVTGNPNYSSNVVMSSTVLINVRIYKAVAIENLFLEMLSQNPNKSTSKIYQSIPPYGIHRYYHTLSGGRCKRINMFKAVKIMKATRVMIINSHALYVRRFKFAESGPASNRAKKHKLEP